MRAFGVELISVSALCCYLVPRVDDASEVCDQRKVLKTDSEHTSIVQMTPSRRITLRRDASAVHASCWPVTTVYWTPQPRCIVFFCKRSPGCCASYAAHVGVVLRTWVRIWTTFHLKRYVAIYGSSRGRHCVSKIKSTESKPSFSEHACWSSAVRSHLGTGATCTALGTIPVSVARCPTTMTYCLPISATTVM